MDTPTETPVTLETFQLDSTTELSARTAGDQTWFVAADVCRALGLTNSRQTLTKLDEDEKGVWLIYTLGGTQKCQMVNESGLYTVILRCDAALKPGTKAHTFRKWVTQEVLPTLRKKGEYAMRAQAEEEERQQLRRQMQTSLEYIERAADQATSGLIHGSLSPSWVRAFHGLSRLRIDALKLRWEMEQGRVSV